MALVENARVGFDYEILETFEAGLELFGFETRSLRAGHGSLKGAHVVVRGGEAYLVGATIPPWQIANAPANFDPERSRRLLLNKKEIRALADAESAAGLTIVPLAIYNKVRHLKLSLAIARGKKKQDKRATIKQRDTERELRRTLKM